MMKAFLGALILAWALGSVDAAARALEQPAAERSARQAECLKKAKLQRFGRQFAARNRFMRRCMARA